MKLVVSELVDMRGRDMDWQTQLHSGKIAGWEQG